MFEVKKLEPDHATRNDGKKSKAGNDGLLRYEILEATPVDGSVRESM